MPDVSSSQPAGVRLWVSFDVHKLSIVAATLPPNGGQPELTRIETTEVRERMVIRHAVGRVLRTWFRVASIGFV
jgi:hypothetical protein